jgi:hypothetical protein
MKSMTCTSRSTRLQVNAAILFAAICTGVSNQARAEPPPPPCHPNPQAAADRNLVSQRGDIRHLPDPLQDLLERIADRPHSFLPV